MAPNYQSPRTLNSSQGPITRHKPCPGIQLQTKNLIALFGALFVAASSPVLCCQSIATDLWLGCQKTTKHVHTNCSSRAVCGEVDVPEDLLRVKIPRADHLLGTVSHFLQTLSPKQTQDYQTYFMFVVFLIIDNSLHCIL